MSKRSWDEAGGDDHAASSASRRSTYTGDQHGVDSASSAAETASHHIPMISRKVKACAACRKHKVGTSRTLCPLMLCFPARR